jgi:recombination protein RecT
MTDNPPAVITVDGSKPIQAMTVEVGDKILRGTAALAIYFQTHQKAISDVSATHIRPELLLKVALNCITKSEKLMRCTANSIYGCLLQAAELGLEPGSALGLAHLVPYKESCILIVDYKGYIELAYRSGLVSGVDSFVVYEGDRFDFSEGVKLVLKHTPDFASPNYGDPLKITHAVSLIWIKGSSHPVYAVVARKEIEGIRKRSAAAKSDFSPWVSDYAEMAKKTAIRRAMKKAPKSTEMRKALALENQNDVGQNIGPIFDGDVEEVVIEKEVTKTSLLADRIAEEHGTPAYDPYADVSDEERAANDERGRL